MHEIDFEDLLNRYRNDECTRQEIAEVESWYIHMTANSTPDDVPADLEAVGRRIWNNIHVKAGMRQGKVVHGYFRKRGIAAAAVVLIVLLSGTFFFWIKSGMREKPAIVKSDNISSVNSKVILELSDGRTIDLTNADTGTLVNHSGVSYSKSANGHISEKITDMQKALLNRGMNTIRTLNGGRTEISLADGSLVCLNAASSLTYPNVFADNKREVTLDGEGYFEVTRDAGKPFIVTGKEQIIKVVGTHFNVKSYANEAVLTTLLEGKVIVQRSSSAASKSLVRGQQSVLNGEEFEVKSNVDLKDITSWRGGELVFSNTPLHEALRQISRHYDITVNYDDLPERTITARLNTNMALSEIVNELEIGSGVELKSSISKSRQH